MFEIVKLSQERLEIGIVGIFFQCVMQQADTEHKLTRVFLRHTLFLLGKACQSGEVVVTAKIKTHHFLNLSINHFGNIEMVRTFFFVTVHNIYVLVIITSIKERFSRDKVHLI